MVASEWRRSLLMVLPFSFLLACGDDDALQPTPPPPPPLACADEVPEALRLCIRDVNEATHACYKGNDAARSLFQENDAKRCASNDAASVEAIETMRSIVMNSCDDGDLFSLSEDHLADRLEYACQSNADSIAWRTYGGPQAAAWTDIPVGPCAGGSTAYAKQQYCLTEAHRVVASYVDFALKQMNDCLAGETCDASTVGERIRTRRTKAVRDITNACPASFAPLDRLVGLTPKIYVDRASDQVDCIISTAHPEVAPFTPRCGPSNVDGGHYDAVAEARVTGGWTRLELHDGDDPVEGDDGNDPHAVTDDCDAVDEDDEKVKYPKCGHGGKYFIWVRLAPKDEPLDRVVILLQGGALCLTRDQCKERPDHLFRADDEADNEADDEDYCLPRHSWPPEDWPPMHDGPPDPDWDPGLIDTCEAHLPIRNNPFRNWTMLYLPYCTQDVFLGGGCTDYVPDPPVHRYGAVNLRAGVRVLRDIIWKMMDQEVEDEEVDDQIRKKGYRPDELKAIFGGQSAGGYGAMYNYHWMLDDLLWQRTTAFLDASCGLDNDKIRGVKNLGALMVKNWKIQPNLPPYCFSGDCAVGPNTFAAYAPRLNKDLGQQYLIVSNQRDDEQRLAAFFLDEFEWIEAIREAYCRTKGLNGIEWYLRRDFMSQHTVSSRIESYFRPLGGVLMKDWIRDAVNCPGSVTDLGLGIHCAESDTEPNTEPCTEP